MSNNEVTLFNGFTPSIPDESHLREIFKRLADFQTKLTETPDRAMIDKTPDGNAETLVISYIENKLDEMYSGLWSTEKFEWKQIGNEIAGSMVLKVFHPKCGVWIERVGCASIQIMVDAVPFEFKYNKDDPKPVAEKKAKERNQWALNMENKKANALYMGFGKLKAECLKNAAKSLGVTFGRDLNRKKVDSKFEPDAYSDEDFELKEEIKTLVATCKLSEVEQKQILGLVTPESTTQFHRLIAIKERLKNNQQ